MGIEMNIRLIVAIISIILEEGALAVVVLLGLPMLDINMPIAGLFVLMALWLTISIVLYRIGSRALRTRPVISLPDMIGGVGKVVSPLDPEGLVRVKGELWVARSADGEKDVGTEIIVMTQDSLKLVVRKNRPDTSLK